MFQVVLVNVTDHLRVGVQKPGAPEWVILGIYKKISLEEAEGTAKIHA